MTNILKHNNLENANIVLTKFIKKLQFIKKSIKIKKINKRNLYMLINITT